MKKILVMLPLAFALFVGAGGAPVFAQKAAESQGFEAELDAAIQEMANTQIGTLTMADVEKLAGRISVAHQKVQYVRRAAHASLMFPGAGQFMTGDTLGGSLFLAGDIVLAAGTLVGAYFLLPSNVQFTNIDYLNTPISNIGTAWGTNGLVAYLPSIGVLVVGRILTGILRHASAAVAAREARENIADGKVTFTPNFDFDGHRGFGMGMQMKW